MISLDIVFSSASWLHRHHFFFVFCAVIEQEPAAQLSWLGVKGRSIPPVSQIHTPPTWTSPGGSLCPGAFWWNCSSPTWPSQERPTGARRTSWSSLTLTPPWVSFHHSFLSFFLSRLCVEVYQNKKKKSPTCRSRSCSVEMRWVITSVNCKQPVIVVHSSVSWCCFISQLLW